MSSIGQAASTKKQSRNKAKIKRYAGGCDNNGTRSHVHSQYTVTCYIYTASTLLNLFEKKKKKIFRGMVR